MEETKKRTICEKRIDRHLKGRLDELLPDVSTWKVLECARYLKAAGRSLRSTTLHDIRNDVLDLVRERARESLRSVEKLTTFKLCLSWGGAADFFEVDWSEDSRSWVGGRYVFQDWSDCADRQITDEQAEQLANIFGICPEGA